MRTTQFLAILLTGFAGAVMASCSKEEKETPVVENEVTFTVGVGQLGTDSADIVVRHDGKNSAQWYGFLTEDIQSDEESLIQAQLSNVSKSTIHVGTSQTVELTGLNDDSIYKYIAFGVNVDKERYGKPASVTFTTNPDYNVTFKVEAGEVTTSSATFTVSHDGKERFTWYGFATDDLASDVKELAQKAYNDLLTDGAVTDASVLLSGTSKTVTVEGLAFDKEYRYIAFGVDQVGGKALYFGTPGEASAQTLVDYDAITFSVEPVTVRKNAATFTVSYNTASALTWYAFNTDDLTTAVADLVKAKVAGITTADYQLGNAVETSVDGLQPLTNYRFIVTGIKDGAVYGTPADFAYTSADEDYDAITFSAEVVETTKSGARIKVSHDGGADKFQWIAVLSSDLTSAAADILPKPEEVAADAVKSGQEVELEIEGLEEKTEYRYIVSGYREDASGNKYLYGTPADITFKTDSFWKVNPDWTVTFEGKTDDYAGYPYKFTNTVASGSTSGKYFFALYDQDEVDKYDDLEDLIAANIEDEVDYLKYLVENNPSRYPDLASLLYDGSSNIWYKLSFKTYYVFAIGLTDEGEATGKYAYAKYTNEPSDEDKAAYNKWLGQWIVNRGSTQELWTVEEKQMASTYTISGFEEDFEVEATFNAEGGTMDIYVQSEVYEYNHSTYGPIKVGLYGNYWNATAERNYYITGSYRITSISMNADGKTAEMTAPTINLSGGNSVVLNGFQLRYVIQEGQYAGYNLNTSASPVDLPGTISRPSDTGSAAYNAWLGSWSLNRGDATDTWVISQNVADVSYTITGIEGLDSYREFTAGFDKSTGELTIKTQKDIYTYTTQGYNVSDHLYGHVPYNGTDYYITGDYELCRGSISGNSATLTGSKVYVDFGEGSQAYDLAGMQVYAWDADANSRLGVYLEDGEEYTTFPATLTKASGASTMSNSTVGGVKRSPAVEKEAVSVELPMRAIAAVVSEGRSARMAK